MRASMRPSPRPHSRIWTFPPTPASPINLPDRHFPLLAGPRALLRCQRIRPYLEVHHLARRSFAGLHVEWRARAHRRVEAAPFPTRLRIVDPPVHPLRVEADRIRNAQDDPLAVLQHEQPF